MKDSGYNLEIPDAVASSEQVNVTNVEYIPDAYEAILQAEKDGLITILRYDDLSEKRKKINMEIIKEEYKKSIMILYYRHFLIGNFPDILKGE